MNVIAIRDFRSSVYGAFVSGQEFEIADDVARIWIASKLARRNTPAPLAAPSSASRPAHRSRRRTATPVEDTSPSPSIEPTSEPDGPDTSTPPTSDGGDTSEATSLE